MQHRGAQCKQSGRLRLARNELAQRHEKRIWVASKCCERGHRFIRQHPVGGRVRPCDVTKTLNGVHTSDNTGVCCPHASATVSPVAELVGDPDLDPINGDSRPFSDWMTTFPMLLGVIDPYTHESSWLLDTMKRIFHHYRDAGVRVAWLAVGPADGVTKFLGPYAEEFLTFADPTGAAAKALGVETLPALVFVRQDGVIIESAQGWNPATWRKVTGELEELTGWTTLNLPGPNDPSPYAGTNLQTS